MDTKMEEKKIMHYSSHQKILLVGEGDFSFSLSLAKAFGSASNMVATSLDSKESLIGKYSRASTNLSELENLGCTIVHEVDAHTMNNHPLLQTKYFDRIVFNFPHAGFIYRECDLWQIELHKHVVSGFLKSAREMVSPDGEIHVTHKTAGPFCKWEVVTLAEEAELFLVEEVPFFRWDYPGYINKRGSGPKCDKTFPVGDCSTFKFSKVRDMESMILEIIS
ncbi:hypothetical protein E2542_SST21787 [Spatholobus suberectus]|nr:hypothetical protein E2542_SST21787 [Spatholobus suberectus]